MHILPYLVPRKPLNQTDGFQSKPPQKKFMIVQDQNVRRFAEWELTNLKRIDILQGNQSFKHRSNRIITYLINQSGDSFCQMKFVATKSELRAGPRSVSGVENRVACGGEDIGNGLPLQAGVEDEGRGGDDGGGDEDIGNGLVLPMREEDGCCGGDEVGGGEDLDDTRPAEPATWRKRLF
ncbi:hypothetical protein K435DRAFT_803626 [Dendrothele bispora CBS 962.96]|uniref:Uncharacterized protein n=1 Tax=Dendrothele bispora (strain CBS 962.96) TaxID=1314807 RepID=A0A4S8LH88_DENBC|nr:hypothetical protein K435DRAFT_803626 [Dendrothele bispora CBS 962.96]